MSLDGQSIAIRGQEVVVNATVTHPESPVWIIEEKASTGIYELVSFYTHPSLQE